MDATARAGADRRLAALFPEAAAEPVLPWWKRPRGIAVIAAVVLALIASGFVAAGAFASSGDSYRTATVGAHDVDAELTGVATIEPVAQATVAFPVAGTVASVNAQVGDAVAAGGVLASLDTTQLEQNLHAQEAALAQAQLKLTKALSGQSVSGAGNGSSTGGGASAASGTGAALSAARSAAPTARIVLTAATTDTALSDAQQAVLTAQQQVDAALAAAATALSSETTVCAPFVDPSAATAGSTPGANSDPPPDATACQQAIQAVVTAQGAVSDAQKALATASTALDTLLAQRAAQPAPAPAPTTAPSATGRTGSGSATGTGGSGTGGSTGSGFSAGSTTSSPSAADLVAYQKAVDAAAAAVAMAQQSVAQATITSPISGTVVALNLHVGDSVTSGSSTANVVVQGAGGYEVSTTVSVDRIPNVAVGQSAGVVPDGSHRMLPGTVVSISAVPDATSTATTVYRVVMGLTDPNTKLDNGATGTVSIVTQRARSALAVPTSAVDTTRNRHTVTVLDGGSPRVVSVQVGVLGDTWTEIKHGLSRGQQVLLADVSAALPSSATASSSASTATPGATRLGGFGGGGFGGAGGAGGGFTGAGTRNR